MLTKRTPCQLKSILIKDEKDEDGDVRTVVKLRFAIAPFTKEQADELNVKSRLFDASTGEPHANVIDGKVAIESEGIQTVTFYRTPDDALPKGLVLRNVVVDKALKYRREKTPTLSAVLTLVTDGLPEPKALFYLIEGHGRSHYLAFESEQADLLEDEEQARARTPALRHPKGKKAKDELRPGVTEEFDDAGNATADALSPQALEAAARLAESGPVQWRGGGIDLRLTPKDAPRLRARA